MIDSLSQHPHPKLDGHRRLGFTLVFFHFILVIPIIHVGDV